MKNKLSLNCLVFIFALTTLVNIAHANYCREDEQVEITITDSCPLLNGSHIDYQYCIRNKNGICIILFPYNTIDAVMTNDNWLLCLPEYHFKYMTRVTINIGDDIESIQTSGTKLRKIFKHTGRIRIKCEKRVASLIEVDDHLLPEASSSISVLSETFSTTHTYSSEDVEINAHID